MSSGQFTAVISERQVFILGKSFPPSIMIVSKEGCYPSESPIWCSILGWAPSLTHKHYTKLERPATKNTLAYQENS